MQQRMTSGEPMPLFPLRPIKRRSQDDFHQLDHKVMSVAFATQNDLGRLYDEIIYKREFALRLAKAGISVAREFSVRAQHGDFERSYFIDLLVDEGVVYEAKAVASLSDAHRSQSLHYLFLTETQHGKLINFRPIKVEHEFVSTQLTLADRRDFHILDQGWQRVNAESLRLRELISNLVRDWGTFLSLECYRDALIHFFGGEPSVSREIELTFERRVIGTHRVNLLSADTIFALSAILSDFEGMRQQLLKLLHLTPCAYLQWTNIHSHTIRLTTLSRFS
jgi:GxxExxY protein